MIEPRELMEPPDCWADVGRGDEYPLDGEEIMMDDTHCFDCGNLLDECECEED